MHLMHQTTHASCLLLALVLVRLLLLLLQGCWGLLLSHLALEGAAATHCWP
jgi:hypothetical protein